MKLPLPSPPSPRQLDEKILAHSRTKAAPPPLANVPMWLSGLVTASVLVVVVVLVEDPFTRGGTSPLENYPINSDETVTVRSADAAVVAARQDNTGTLPETKSKLYAERSTMPARIAADTEKALPTARAAPQAAVTAFSAPEELELSDAVAATSSEIEQGSAKEVSPTCMPRKKPGLASNDLHASLDDIQQLIESHGHHEASIAYQKLRDENPECGLPDAMESAFEQFRP